MVTLEKKLWLLPYFMTVATYCYYEKVTELCALQLYFNSLIYVYKKSKVTENIFNFLEWLQNMRNCKFLFKQPLFLSKHSPLKKN